MPAILQLNAIKRFTFGSRLQMASILMVIARLLIPSVHLVEVAQTVVEEQVTLKWTKPTKRYVLSWTHGEDSC